MRIGIVRLLCFDLNSKKVSNFHPLEVVGRVSETLPYLVAGGRGP